MKRFVLLAAIMAAPNIAWAQEYKPDFNCSVDHSKDSIATMLCQDSDAAKHELIFDQTYYALRQLVGPSGWKALKQEVIADDDALKECVSPFVDERVPLEADPECYSKKMDKITEKYKSRLSGSALEEASRPIDEHIALQQKLINLGYFPDESIADGVYGESTRKAIGEWKSSSGLPQADDFISNSDASALKESGNKKIIKLKNLKFKRNLQIDDSMFTINGDCNNNDNTCSGLSLNIKSRNENSILNLSSLDDLGIPFFSFDRPVFGRSDVVAYVSVYTGGAHCCVDSLLIFKDKNKKWSITPLPERDGGLTDGSPYQDLAGDGHHEIAINDKRFDYKFDCYACSFSPSQIFEIRNDQIENVSGEKRFLSFHEDEIKKAESAFVKDSPNMGFHAGIAAIKAQEGNFLGYWDKKIQGNPDLNNIASISYCDAIDLPRKDCPSNGNVPLKFPNALAIFLYKAGYIDQYDLKYTGYSVRDIDKSEYDRTHAPNIFKYYIKIAIYKIKSWHYYVPSLSEGVFYSLVFFVFFLIFLTIAFYFLPTFIASKTKSKHFWLIAFVNLFFGWTFLGWLAALLMALMMDRDKLAA